MKPTTLRPGFLVQLKTSLRGNVKYQRSIIEETHITTDGTERAVWDTVREIEDPAEHALAVKAQSKCRSIVASVCRNTAFGLLCPEIDVPKLEGKIQEARDLAASFNAAANVTQLGVYVLTGRIAPDDLSAVQSINSEIRELMEDMAAGLRNLDVEVVRKAADKARQVGGMLTPEAEARVKLAIDTARSAARRIVKAGEIGVAEIDEAAIRRVMEARTAFLDFSDTEEIVVPEDEGRALALEAEPDEGVVTMPFAGGIIATVAADGTILSEAAAPAPRIQLDLI